MRDALFRLPGRACASGMIMARNYSGPFAAWPRPSPAEARVVREALVSLHGAPRPFAKKMDQGQTFCGAVNLTVLDSLVRTILSQNTTDLTRWVG